MLQMPTCAFFRSSSVSPMPYSIACAAGCVSSCVKIFEYLFSSLILFAIRRKAEKQSPLCLLLCCQLCPTIIFCCVVPIAIGILPVLYSIQLLLCSYYTLCFFFLCL